jgi:hypothetical protein
MHTDRRLNCAESSLISEMATVFTGVEGSSLQAGFVIDDTAVTTI